MNDYARIRLTPYYSCLYALLTPDDTVGRVSMYRQWGNSGVVRLNKDLLRLMSTEISGVLEVEVKDNRLILCPAAPEYSLNDLLEKSPEGCFSLSDEGQAWLNPPPTGKEGL